MDIEFKNKLFKLPKGAVVLASGSVGRRELLESHGYIKLDLDNFDLDEYHAGVEAGKKYFFVIPSIVDDSSINWEYPHENISFRRTQKYVETMASAKIEPFFLALYEIRRTDITVICADTVVWFNNEILEKPITKENCIRNTRMIMGNKCYALTGMAIFADGKVKVKSSHSTTTIDIIPNNVIEEICSCDKTLQCAGYRSDGAIAPYHHTSDKATDKGLDIKFVRKIIN